MTQAIKLTLKDDGFRAGRFSVGYVVCDDSGAAGTWSAATLRANARAAARNRDVVGVIGTLDSGCARAELPVLGAAGVLLVSPLNTATDLTRRPRGTIARLSATDDAQAAAAARFLAAARSRDGRGAVRRHAARQRLTARRSCARRARLGLRVVARGHADAAYVGGVLSGPTRADSSQPRARARRRRPARARRRLRPGRAARRRRRPGGGGRVPLRRRRPGRAARRARGATSFATSRQRSERSPHPYAVYAAQAAQLLLDAIARSNGTRTSVAREVLRARGQRRPDRLVRVRRATATRGRRR